MKARTLILRLYTPGIRRWGAVVRPPKFYATIPCARVCATTDELWAKLTPGAHSVHIASVVDVFIPSTHGQKLVTRWHLTLKGQELLKAKERFNFLLWEVL